MDLSDGQLVAMTRAGSAEAYRSLVERHYSGCLRYATRALGNEADAEEAVQDTFERAYRFLQQFDDERKFKGWLFGILLNRCRTLGAARQRTDGKLVSLEALESAEHAQTTLPDFGVDVQRALMRLEPEYREAVLLKYADDWTYEEIADATGTGVSALKMRVKRARAQLMELLRGIQHVA